MPLLSVVLNRALGLLAQGDDVSVKDLSAVIEEDVVITGSLLSIANSALYCGNSRVASVRPAIVRLGLTKTRNVLLGLTVSRCFASVRAPGPWSSSRFNGHSLAVATLSDLIVQSVPSEHAEWAFMAGLLHDIGLPLIAVGLPEQYRMKSASARRARLLERTGQRFWQDESFDHWVGDTHEGNRIIRYIQTNPVAAGFVETPKEWRWSSAWARPAHHVSAM